MILIMSRFKYQLTIGGDIKDGKPEESGCLVSAIGILSMAAVGAGACIYDAHRNK